MPTRWIWFSIIVSCLCSWNAMAEPPLKFQFGPKGNVRDQDIYDATRGYGFEPAAGAGDLPRNQGRQDLQISAPPVCRHWCHLETAGAFL